MPRCNVKLGLFTKTEMMIQNKVLAVPRFEKKTWLIHGSIVDNSTKKISK